MRWSSRRPFAVDLRSARATPAPPLVMVGYSTKLAVTTTLTSLVFSGLARVPHPEVSVLVAAPFVVWSLVRLLHARDSWTDPVSAGPSRDDRRWMRRRFGETMTSMGVLMLVRHGQASFGSEDYDVLSSRGVRQSRKVAEALSGYGVAPTTPDPRRHAPPARDRRGDAAGAAALGRCPSSWTSAGASSTTSR